MVFVNDKQKEFYIKFFREEYEHIKTIIENFILNDNYKNSLDKFFLVYDELKYANDIFILLEAKKYFSGLSENNFLEKKLKIEQEKLVRFNAINEVLHKSCININNNRTMMINENIENLKNLINNNNYNMLKTENNIINIKTELDNRNFVMSEEIIHLINNFNKSLIKLKNYSKELFEEYCPENTTTTYYYNMITML